jgi:hypothetical protein
VPRPIEESTPKTVCWSRPGTFVSVKPKTNLPAISARLDRSSFTPCVATLGYPQCRRYGLGFRPGRHDYMGLDVINVRYGKIAAPYVFLDPMPS